ncbi:MAG: hypothetical protein HFG51_08810 [Lachnospiraceae bacterium]|nr:hypothetical protein [Lachnospiraceae bacterium]
MDKLDFYPFRRCSKRIDNGTKAASCRMHETDKRESHEINSTVNLHAPTNGRISINKSLLGALGIPELRPPNRR